MTNSDFNQDLELCITDIRETLAIKGEQYGRGEDRLGNFKRTGPELKVTPEFYAFSLVSKHWDALRQFIIELNETGESTQPASQWNEKTGDIINYMILIRALLRDRGIT